jgi:voltage-gated sodium channel
VTQLARRIAESPLFQNFVLVVILLPAMVVGLETYDDLVDRYQASFRWFDVAIQAFFVLEIAIRLVAFWPRPLRFFTDGWNVFDFAVVAASLLPQSGTFAMVARLARLLRVTRLVSVFPELRLVVSTMLRSIPSMGHVIIMLGLLLYVYGVLGVAVFRDQDPERWGRLGMALLTLFQMLTLEGWVEIQDRVLESYPGHGSTARASCSSGYSWWSISSSPSSSTTWRRSSWRSRRRPTAAGPTTVFCDRSRTAERASNSSSAPCGRVRGRGSDERTWGPGSGRPNLAQYRGAPRLPRGARGRSTGAWLASQAPRDIEGRHGCAGAPRALGGLGGLFGAPRLIQMTGDVAAR